ncbi:transcriptional regulator [Halapricum desulfuricans]|uniref:Putative HTH-type transcriptional regulatory protein HSBGL_0651 n=1 Tax=Halapricum desulfuricans TaxID=2841257 RepID=A0A897NI29_9EURY|nr:transcriptional regulator [Halapricum desulfuricans]QSG09827.1 putative transcriptional regulator [Halapricum desulfuricans]QSG11085.1 putative transcriptional regulator [Halapricum desulfuricans]
MSRSALVENVIAMLEDAGFLVSDRCAIRPKSFDIAGRRGRDTVLVKILGNIDAFDGRTGAEMRRLGEYLEATPLVIGLRTRDEDLKPGVVYFRHGVPVLSPDTAMDLFLEDVPPLIYAAPGGLYVNIDSEILEDARQDREWSLGKLAKELGVSRRTVSKYEDGMDASVDVAAKLEELFDAPLTAPVEVLDGADEVRDDEPTPEDPDVDPEDEPIVTVLTRVGFDVHPTERAPFKTISEDERRRRQMLTGHSEFTETAEKRARIMSSVGKVTRTTPVYVVERATRASVDGTALIEESELEEIEDADELRDLIRERGEEPAD